MKKAVILPVIVIMLATLACSMNIDLPQVESKTTDPQGFVVDVPAPSGSGPVSLEISMGAGQLSITPDSDRLVSGTVRYNIEDWKPKVTQEGNKTTISQEHTDSIAINTETINEWDLALNPKVTYDLDINAGAYEGNLDLSGLPLVNLRIDDGASKSEVTFSSLNPVEMESLEYNTGASEVTLNGLGYANFTRMGFDGGAGNYTLDFSGGLKQDAQVDINSGVSQVTIIIPEGMNAVIVLDGALNNVDTSGTWSGSGQRYEADGSGPLLTINIDIGVGNLVLRSQ